LHIRYRSGLLDHHTHPSLLITNTVATDREEPIA
jgi:hypothetical protein